VLVVGGGDGGVVREILKYDHVEHVTLCEIDERVVRVCQQYLPGIASKLEDPRVTMRFEDAVAFVANEPDASWDLVIVDSTDPVSVGEGLFTREFYANVHRILTPDGLMVCQSDAPMVLTQQWRKVLVKVKSQFDTVFPYMATVPTYPGGYWAWTLASKRPMDAPQIQWDRPGVAEQMTRVEEFTRFYNRRVHDAVFDLPNQLGKLAAATLKELPETLLAGV